jgi:DNA-binding response OmpR family regulator
LNARLLVIDDETNIRTMMRLALEHAGYTVDTATDGPEGLQTFAQGQEWDLVLLDHRMPGMTGIDVLREMFTRCQNTRVILITAFGTMDLALEAARLGATDFLRKPFTADTLRAAVRTALARTPEPCPPGQEQRLCRDFARTNINGFSFSQSTYSVDPDTGDIVCQFYLTRSEEPAHSVAVLLPAYVMELAKAYGDIEGAPGGDRFWQAMCEEALATYLWQNAEAPENDELRIEDLSSSLQRWLDSVLTVSVE